MIAKPNEKGMGTAMVRPWMDSEDLRRRIARKAHELFEKRGSRHGRDREDWLEAERLVHLELEAEVQVQPAADVTRHVAPNPYPPKEFQQVRRPGEKPGRGTAPRR